MGKRVSNKRGTHVGARSGRVRIGYWRHQKMSKIERAMEVHRKKTVLGAPMDKESQLSFAALNKALMKLIPKRMERRGVR